MGPNISGHKARLPSLESYPESYYNLNNVCLCVCLFVPLLLPGLLADLDQTWWDGGGTPGSALEGLVF